MIVFHSLRFGAGITIDNWNSANKSRLEQFEFADGTDDIELAQISRDNLVILPLTEHQY